MLISKAKPLPWRLEGDGKMSAIVAADDTLVCGSLISEQLDPRVRASHKLIIEAVSKI